MSEVLRFTPKMPLISKKVSLIFFVFVVLLVVGVGPLLTTGWLLSERSARELRAVEGRYQTQLVQDKARQIEMFGQRYCDLVSSYARALELTHDETLLSSAETNFQIEQILEKDFNLLAFTIRPINGEPLSAYRSEKINLTEIEQASRSVLANLGKVSLALSQPQRIATGNETALTIASPIMNGEEISGAVVAVVSLSEISRLMTENRAKPLSEQQLWDAGLPITFVVEEQGKAIFHTDFNVAQEQRLMTHLKIVQEWQESLGKIQSALVPFTAEKNNEKRQMIGAYSTVNINNQLNLGVIAMQDEDKALGSVTDMRNQTWLVSLAIAVFALILGYVFTRQLTTPIFELVSAAQKIAAGNLSTRVEPKRINELNALGETFNTMSNSLEENIAKLAQAANENHELFVGTVKALAAAIDGKDRYTRGHSERVARFSVAIGQKLGIDESELEKLRISALLHDVGKIAIDDAILKKPAALTAEEFEIMKQHPQKGYKIMSQIPAMHDFLPGMYMHHEMVNGKGYPQGLKGNEIPMQAKIVSVADTFDAMTTDRPYQKGMSLEDALSRIESFVGTRYDSKVVAALIQACDEGKIRPVSVSQRLGSQSSENFQPADAA